VLEWYQVTVDDNWYAAAAAVCVRCGPTAHRASSHAYTEAYWLPVVRAMLTLAAKVWLCGMTRV